MPELRAVAVEWRAYRLINVWNGRHRRHGTCGLERQAKAVILDRQEPKLAGLKRASVSNTEEQEVRHGEGRTEELWEAR